MKINLSEFENGVVTGVVVLLGVEVLLFMVLLWHIGFFEVYRR